MAIIQLNNLCYQYSQDIKVFDALDFSLEPGQRVGIIGANGSGKTTLFSLIMGLSQPQSGDIILFDKTCQKETDFNQARQRMGYLFQDPDDQVFCPTVEEDIAFGPLNLNVPLDEVQGRISSLLEAFGIESLRQRITTKLSWGQKRLVSLAGVLAMNPEVLILDEPTASIDDNIIQKMSSHLKSTHHSLLIASHDMPFIEKLCSEIYLLKDGRLTHK